MCFLYSYIIGSRLSSFFFQAEDGIRYLVRSRGLGDVYKRQSLPSIFNSSTDNPLSYYLAGKTSMFANLPEKGVELSLIHI